MRCSRAAAEAKKKKRVSECQRAAASCFRSRCRVAAGLPEKKKAKKRAPRARRAVAARARDPVYRWNVSNVSCIVLSICIQLHLTVNESATKIFIYELLPD